MAVKLKLCRLLYTLSLFKNTNDNQQLIGKNNLKKKMNKIKKYNKII